MTEIATFQFLNPAWLLLLPVVWLLSWIYSRHNRHPSMWTRVCDPKLLQQMLPGDPNQRRNRWLASIMTIVLTLGVLATAGPSWRQQSYPMMESASARVVVLDLSRSMLVEDVGPNRLTHAVSVAREILASDFDGETGLVVFAGAAFVVSPLSRDAKTLLAFLDALDPSTMPEDGTRIDLAIDSAQGLLLASIAGYGQIFIITAGDSNRQETVQMARNAADLGHNVSILVIGTAEGGPLLNADGGLLRDSQGRLLLSRSNFTLMERIAQAGKGVTVALTRDNVYEDPLISILGANQLIESKQSTDKSDRDAANDGIWIVCLMLPFALLLFRKNLIWMILLGITLPGDGELYAKDWNSYWSHSEQLAFDAYQQGDYRASYELSRKPEMQAAALYRSGQYQQALELYADEESSQAAYNRGNTLAQLEQFDEAILAYQQAITLNPALESARYNKRLLELYLEQQSENENRFTNDSDKGDSANDTLEQFALDTRNQINQQLQTNPADNVQLGPGMGASAQSGQVDPFEYFDGLEHELERFVFMTQNGDLLPKSELIERWIRSLPETSTDLYRRKFLRDYQRQQQQIR